MSFQFLTILASILCLLGLACEVFRMRRSEQDQQAFLQAPLFIPLYAAGILQWFLFGIAQADIALTLSCPLQLYLLSKIAARYWRFQRS